MLAIVPKVLVDPSVNDLDRAIMAAIRSQANVPNLYRQLLEGELWFLVPYHPEVEGEIMELKPGMPLPFVQLQDARGPVVPLFSSEDRVDEGLAAGKVAPRTFTAGAMPAIQALEILGSVGLRAVLNKSCATGELTLPPELLRDLANGTLLDPPSLDEGDGPAQGTLQIIDPADYPTAMVQRLFECLRRHRSFRAAWIFGDPGAVDLPEGRKRYHALVHMDPRDDVIFHELSLVARTKWDESHDLQLGLLDEKDPAYIAALREQVQPFYTAAG